MIDVGRLRERAAATGSGQPIPITNRYALQLAAELEQGRAAMAELARIRNAGQISFGA